MGTSLSPSPATYPPVLVATADAALQEVLIDLLAEGGFVAHPAQSLSHALTLCEQRAYAMVLAEIFVGAVPRAWDDACTLARRVYPVPVGLLVTHALMPEAAQHTRFAFVQRMPFEIDELLARVSTASARPLTPRQVRWAGIVERYHAAIASGDWNTLCALCADDVICYPPANSCLTTTRRLEGKAAVRAYFESAAAHYHRVTSADLAIFPQPRGIIARHTATWLDQDEEVHQAAITLRLRFSGDRISQIGLRTNRVSKIGVRSRAHTRPA